MKLLNHTDIASSSLNPIILAEYYLQGQGGSLNAIAKTASGVDFDAILAAVSTTIDNAIAVSLDILHKYSINCCMDIMP